MKPIRLIITITTSLAILALSAALFMWATLFFAPLILVPMFIAVTKSRAYFKINTPHRKETPCRP